MHFFLFIQFRLEEVSYHARTSSEVLPSLQEDLAGMLMVVDHHSVVRAQVESKQRAVPAEHTHRCKDSPECSKNVSIPLL